jgi:hypothetical protein
MARACHDGGPIVFEDNLAKARHQIRLASHPANVPSDERAERIDHLVVALHEIVHAMELLHKRYRPREPE